MNIFDRIKFTARLKTRWKQAKAEQRLEGLLERTSCDAELLRNLEYIVENTIQNVKRIAIDGMRIGDRIDTFPENKIQEVASSQWPGTLFYHCTNGVTYKVILGTVVEFFLNSELAHRTGLRHEQDVLDLLGKPDKIEKIRNGPVTLLNVHIYQKRHLTVEIDGSGRVARINIS